MEPGARDDVRAGVDAAPGVPTRNARAVIRALWEKGQKVESHSDKSACVRACVCVCRSRAERRDRRTGTHKHRYRDANTER